MKTVTTRLQKLNTKLLRVTSQLQKLQQKKDECVNSQFSMCDVMLDSDLVNNRRYQRLIDLDFELAFKIEEFTRKLRNVKSQIYRANKKVLLCN